MAKTCYFCGQPATTREHIPGRAFYPEQKDLPAGSPDVRENMLIVPAMARMDPDDGGREVEEALEGQAITLVGGPRDGWGGLNVLCVTVPLAFALSGEGLCCGWDSLTAACSAYRAEFPFTGTIRRVTVEVGK